MNWIKLITATFILLAGGNLYAQNGAITGYCVKGATPATTSGLNSTNTLQGVVPGGPAGCLVQVYLTGTTTPATLFSSVGGGTLNNPFRASVSGQWLFFAATSGKYDVVLSGGLPPNAYSNPVTLTGLNSGGGAEGVISINGSPGAFTFNGGGVSCTGTTCTFSGGGGGSVSLLTNNVTNTSQSVLNFTSANGFSFSNPSGGLEEIGVDGTHFLPINTGSTSLFLTQAGTYGTPAGTSGITALTGDGTASGPGSAALTLATVNGSPGSCGDATHVCQITTNGKGLITTQAAVAITGGGTAVTINGGSTLSTANFNGSTPTASSGFQNSTFQVSGSNVSVENPLASSSVFGLAKVDGTTITSSGGVISATATPLPTATGPGQIISSTAAGVTYAVQPQIFYNQTGDTIASIETECSSLCTYVVTVPQTITLTGNHTLNANVSLRFEKGGIWTVNGASDVLTIGSGKVEVPTPHIIFAVAGTATVAGLADSYPDWFGGVMSQTDEALRKAVAATGDGSTFRGIIHFRATQYWSDYCAEATNPFSKNYITFAGAGKPMPSLTRNQLIPGSGTILVGCLQPDFSGLSLGLHLSDLGIDRGFTVDATYFAGAQENSFIGTTWSGDLNSPYGDDFQVNNVAAMDYDTAGIRHAFAFEHASNGVIHGLYTYGGNFGVVNKSLNMQGDDIHIEAANTSFIFKSDNTRSFGSWTNFSNIYISDGLLGDGSGDHLGTIGLQVPGNLNNTWTGLNISNANIQGQSDAIEVDGDSTGIHLSNVMMDNIGNFCLKSTGGTITDFSLRGWTCTRYNASGGGNPAISLASNFANPILSDGYMSSAANVIAIDNFSANATLSNITVQASGSAGFGIFGETSSFAHVTHFKANGVVAETAGATADIAFDIEALNRTDLNQQTLGNAALLGVGDGAARGWLDYAAADTLSLRSMGSTTGTPGSIVFRNFSSDLSVGGIVLTISPFGNLSGPGTLALTGQINSNTGFEIGGLAPSGHCMVGNGTNYVDSATCGTASAIPFSGVTSGTNTTAAMVVGAGASLNFTSTGTINAATLLGNTWAAPGTIGGTTPGAITGTTIVANSGYLGTTGGVTSSGTANSGANFNSGAFQMFGSIWNGTAAVNDIWQLQNVVGTGTNPTSTLSIGHTGSSGVANVLVPALRITGIGGSTQCVQADTNGNLSGTGSACGSGGSATIIQVNGTPTTTATPVNLQTSTANTVGLTITPSNPSVGNVKFEITGGSYTGNAATASAVAVGGITGLGTGVATFLATPSSANLATAVTDETGTGKLTFATSPAFLGTPDASGATQFKLPVAASFATAANGEIGYDTTALNWHMWGNGVDNINAIVPTATTITNTHCAEWLNTAGVITLTDSGSTCGGGGGTPAYPLTITGGVSGGIVYGSSATQLTVAPLITAGQIVLSGGAGAAPTGQAIGTSGAVVPLLSGVNTFSGATNTFVGIVGNTLASTGAVTAFNFNGSGGSAFSGSGQAWDFNTLVTPSSLSSISGVVGSNRNISNGGGTTTGGWQAWALTNSLGTATSNIYNGSVPMSEMFIGPTINVGPTSTTGYAALHVNVTETSVSTAANFLALFQVGSVTKASIDRTGTGLFSGTVTSALGNAAITSATGATGVTSVTCQTAACNVSRGSYTVVGGTATTGTIVTLVWPTTTTAWVCSADMNGGTGFLGIGHSVATATGMTISAGVTVIGTTFTFDYNCVP